MAESLRHWKGMLDCFRYRAMARLPRSSPPPITWRLPAPWLVWIIAASMEIALLSSRLLTKLNVLRFGSVAFLSGVTRLFRATRLGMEF